MDIDQKKIQEMIQNGIVAVGDISNSMDSFFHKKDNKLIYHTFIECFGLNEEFAEKIWQKEIELNKDKIFKSQYWAGKNNTAYLEIKDLIEAIVYCSRITGLKAFL